MLGPNGAGKTTSFRMTCGMIVPNAGTVKLDGVDITDWPMYLRARDGGMGYLAQESSVFRKLTVEKNLLGVMEMLGFDRKTPQPPLQGTAGTVRHQTAAQNRWPCRFPAASGGGWKSPAAWSPIPKSSCSTSRSRASTR